MYCSLTFNLPLRNRRISIFGVDVNHDSESMPSVAAVVASVDDACCQVGEDTGGGPGAHLRMLHVLHAPNQWVHLHTQYLPRNQESTNDPLHRRPLTVTS